MDHTKIIESSEKLKRGQTWCTHCGSMKKVNVSNALSKGWPKCCGYTMTIDSPEERNITK